MTEPPASEPELTDAEVSEQKQVRLAKRARLIESGAEAYPVELAITEAIPALRERFGDLEADAVTGVTVGVAGRVVHLRNTGKLCFAALQSGDGSRIQAMVSLAEVGEEPLERWKELVDLGDHVFVSGEVISSRRGELSILVREWRIAAKAIRPLPNLHTELSEETRVRQRYLDLISREAARSTVRARASVNASLRATFTAHGYLEVETPMLQTMHGGASARPFVTHSNAFDTELYLRIAPELVLKRAVVGGLERVYEINRNFRNEGADSTHSPEFAMLEAYQAYGDYNQMADLTQELVQNAALAVAGSHTVTWADGTEYDLGGEWDWLSMYESLSEASGIPITPETSKDELQDIADRLELEVQHPTAGKLVEELWEHFVKSKLERPTFVADFPVETSPLVRDHRSKPGLVEKWDLYIRGFELATGYSELVDPVIQRERFVEQAALGAKGDVEAMRLDEEFLAALEHGMPPSGGMGMGIDRLLMAITGLGIRETILFPLVKGGPRPEIAGRATVAMRCSVRDAGVQTAASRTKHRIVRWALEGAAITPRTRDSRTRGSVVDVLQDYWANAIYSVAPTILVGLIFWLVMRAIIRADRTERKVYAEIEAEERAKLGLPPNHES
jgi:lysyl-tRNA synthetase class 2